MTGSAQVELDEFQVKLKKGEGEWVLLNVKEVEKSLAPKGWSLHQLI